MGCALMVLPWWRSSGTEPDMDEKKQSTEILLVEDDDSLREVVAALLETEGLATTSVHSAEAAIECIRDRTFDCILSDYRLPGKTGIDVVQALREGGSTTPFILMTAYGTIQIAIEAMKKGANDFITKPFDPDQLLQVIQQVTEHHRIISRPTSADRRRDRVFITHDERAKQILAQAERVARFDTTVLILGESGTGKELLARYVHDHSMRKQEPFVAINCAAMPAELLESEFFGHEAGAFTGATQRRIGILEYASSGTVFLDEVGDMPLELQVKLLRALQEREIKRVGGADTIPIEPRIIAATNISIEQALQEGRLREDFYYRLAVFTLEIPPLRERPNDIEALTSYFLKAGSQKLNKTDAHLSSEAMDFIMKYPWPGNARQLENALERALVLANSEIRVEHLGVPLHLDFELLEDSKLTLPEIVEQATRQAETELIRATLAKTSWNRTEAAKLLGVSYKTLLNKLRDYKIASPSAQVASGDEPDGVPAGQHD